MKRLAWILGVMAMGCGASGISDTAGTVDGCFVGEARACDCDAGTPGEETCTEEGWGACVCGKADAGKPSFEDDASVETDGPPVCGDFRCDEKKGESCETCALDCGECPTCDLAPTCTGAFSVPTSWEALPSFDNAGRRQYASGGDIGVEMNETTCSAPKLKLQLSEVMIHERGVDWPNNLDTFCMITANDGSSSELIITPQWAGISKSPQTYILGVETSTFWGQEIGTVKQSLFNITIKYACYRDKKGDAWKGILDGIGAAAGAAASVPGNPYGWAFGLGGAAAGAAAGAVNSSGVTEWLSVEQTIDRKALLELTNGRTWKIRQSGKSGATFNSKWDFELTIRAWGCSSPRPTPTK